MEAAIKSKSSKQFYRNYGGNLPMGIPAGYHLHPKDSDKFAFIVPSINFKEPYRHYQWVTLPQGMANSSIICQMFVAWVIAPIRHKYSQLYIIYYMDDILLAGWDPGIVLEAFADLQECLAHAGFVIASEKVQQQFPYQFLGQFHISNASCCRQE